MASLLQCEDLREVPSVLSVATILRSSEYSTPIQSHFCPSMPASDLPALTATTVSSSSVWNQSRGGTYNCDANYLEDEAVKDFWSEFEFSGPIMNQRGIDEINQEVEDDQMGRPVLASRKRHKGLLGERFQGSPGHEFHFTPRHTPGESISPVIRHCGQQKAEMETNQEL